MMVEKNVSVIEVESEKEEDEIPIRGPLNFNISDISIKTEQQSAEFVIDMLKHNEIDMNTPFQRSPDLWKRDVMSRFIESMMLRFPIPPFYFDISYKLDNDGKPLPDQPYWQVVDGLQRLSTIRKFITQENSEKRLKLTGLDFFPELEGATYDDLPRSLKRNLHSCQISLFIIYPNTPKPVKHRIFERVNTGGLKLTDQEIRHAINQGKSNTFLLQSVEDGLIANGINIEPGRMRDQELTLRHYAFRILGIEKYDGSMKLYLDDAMHVLDEINEKTAEKLKLEFVNSVQIMVSLLGPLAFRKQFGGSINRSLFDSYTYGLAQLTKMQLRKLLAKRERFEELYTKSLVDNKKNAKYLESISAATARRDNVARRFDVSSEIISRTLAP